MLLDALGQLLQDRVASLVVSTNLFLSEMPPSPDTVVCVRELMGLDARRGFGPNSRDIRRPRVQLQVRSTTYQAGRSLMEEAFDVMDAVANETLSGYRFLRIAAQDSPAPAGEDPSGRELLVANFTVSWLTA
jgi:hypothetical protein